MNTFALHQIEMPVRAVRRVMELEVDGRTLFQDFRKRMIKSGNRKELGLIDGLLEDFAMGLELPPNANKALRGVSSDDDWKEFELKKKELRVYYFLIPPDDSVIILGEFKKSAKEQRNTIVEFRDLKAAFKKYYISQNKEEE